MIENLLVKLKYLNLGKQEMNCYFKSKMFLNLIKNELNYIKNIILVFNWQVIQ